MLSVFVSFAEEDKQLVGKLQKAVADLGDIRLYRYDHHVEPGMQVATKVREAIEKADVMVVLLTKRGATSPWIHEEIGAANALKKRIVPIVAPGASIPPMLAGLEQVTLDPNDAASSIARAATCLKKMLSEKDQREVLGIMALVVIAIAIFK
jgi:hypothetical protein